MVATVRCSGDIRNSIYELEDSVGSVSSTAALAGPGAGLNIVTRKPPVAASTMPSTNGSRIADHPPAGGWITITVTAFTIGAKAKMIDITTAGCPLAPNASNTPSPPADAAIAEVVFVIDGDTIIADIDGTEENVRLIGIDTPEPQGGFRDEECYGNEASAFTRGLLPEGTAIALSRDVEARDRFDRLLAYVYRVDDGLFVNLAVVSEGMAAPLTIPPNVTFADTSSRRRRRRPRGRPRPVVGLRQSQMSRWTAAAEGDGAGRKQFGTR